VAAFGLVVIGWFILLSQVLRGDICLCFDKTGTTAKNDHVAEKYLASILSVQRKQTTPFSTKGA
jgi:hypothetical protein